MACDPDGEWIVSSTAPLTMVAVHAHPDDEAIFTAGATLWARHHGIRTVVVTCTNGQLGIDPSGRAGNHPAHDGPATRRTRLAELTLAAELAGIDRVACLDFPDSGMAGWPGNDDPRSFTRQPIEVVAAAIREIIVAEQARVVLTYDERGFYGHPDHIAVHNAVMAAITPGGTPVQRVFYPVMPHRIVRAARELASEGVAVPAWIEQATSRDDESIDVIIDAERFAKNKQESIAAHVSQVDNADIVALEPLRFNSLFGKEYYQCGWSAREFASDQRDLFGGLR